MMPQDDGMQLDPQTLIPILNQKVGEAAIREAQMEAAITQLLQDQENQAQVIAALKEAADEAAKETT